MSLKAEQPVANYGNPQVEDGYTKIANELLDAIIRHDFSKRELKIVLFVLRKTYGWNKKADVMSLSQILSGTGIERTHAAKSINALTDNKVLLKQPHHNGQLLELNKKYKEWVCGQNSHSVAKTVQKCGQNSHRSVTKTATTKDTSKNNTKDIPEFIPVDAWKGFVAMRKEIKKPLSARAITMAVNKLTKMHEAGYDVAAILDRSTFNNWQDLYEPKEKPVSQSEFINK